MTKVNKKIEIITPADIIKDIKSVFKNLGVESDRIRYREDGSIRMRLGGISTKGGKLPVVADIRIQGKTLFVDNKAAFDLSVDGYKFVNTKQTEAAPVLIEIERVMKSRGLKCKRDIAIKKVSYTNLVIAALATQQESKKRHYFSDVIMSDDFIVKAEANGTATIRHVGYDQFDHAFVDFHNGSLIPQVKKAVELIESIITANEAGERLAAAGVPAEELYNMAVRVKNMTPEQLAGAEAKIETVPTSDEIQCLIDIISCNDGHEISKKIIAETERLKAMADWRFGEITTFAYAIVNLGMNVKSTADEICRSAIESAEVDQLLVDAENNDNSIEFSQCGDVITVKVPAGMKVLIEYEDEPVNERQVMFEECADMTDHLIKCGYCSREGITGMMRKYPDLATQHDKLTRVTEFFEI